MNSDELVQKAAELRKRIQRYAVEGARGDLGDAAQAQVSEFLRTFAGPKSSFTNQAEAAKGHGGYRVGTLTAILDSFIEFLQAGLAGGLSPERKAQIDVVSDILQQANTLLENDQYHPAAAAVLIGASLEEFLRGLVESAGIPISNLKPSIDSYCKILRTAELISKQDAKDITSWAGIRNHAAHGEWEHVSERARIQLMLEGVNLFMRQKSG